MPQTTYHYGEEFFSVFKGEHSMGLREAGRDTDPQAYPSGATL